MAADYGAVAAGLSQAIPFNGLLGLQGNVARIPQA